MVDAELVSSNTRRIAYPDVGCWFVEQRFELARGGARRAVPQLQLCERPPNNKILHGQNRDTTKRQLIGGRGSRHDRKSESRRDSLLHHLRSADPHGVFELNPESCEGGLGHLPRPRTWLAHQELLRGEVPRDYVRATQ